MTKRKKSDAHADSEQKHELEDDVSFSDCYLVCDSGRRFSSVRGLLALKSKVIRDLLASCGPANASDPVEVPLQGEADEDVELLWQIWHGTVQLLDVVLKLKQKGSMRQTSRRITSLLEVAHKYQSAGWCFHSLRRIQRV